VENQRNGLTKSSDGVDIAYSEAGGGPVSLLFIHGGLASRAFWAPQLEALAGTFRMAALDLAGHGGSGRNRGSGASQPSPETCAPLPMRWTHATSSSWATPWAAPWRWRPRRASPAAPSGSSAWTRCTSSTRCSDPKRRARGRGLQKRLQGRMRDMCQALFHPGEHLGLQEWALKIMLSMEPEIVARMMEGLAGYDLGAAFGGRACPFGRSTVISGPRRSSEQEGGARFRRRRHAWRRATTRCSSAGRVQPDPDRRRERTGCSSRPGIGCGPQADAPPEITGHEVHG